MQKVITYQSKVAAINLTKKQVALLKDNRVWPKDYQGEEYCQVSHGLHLGEPTFTDAELSDEVGVQF
jgi:hypothetical protein